MTTMEQMKAGRAGSFRPKDRDRARRLVCEQVASQGYIDPAELHDLIDYGATLIAEGYKGRRMLLAINREYLKKL